MRFFFLLTTLVFSLSLVAQPETSNSVAAAAREGASSAKITEMTKRMDELSANSRPYMFGVLLDYGHFDAVKYLVTERGWDPGQSFSFITRVPTTCGPLVSRSEYRARPTCKDVIVYEENEKAKQNAEFAEWLFDQGGKLGSYLPSGTFKYSQLPTLKLCFERGELTDKQKTQAVTSAIRVGALDMLKYLVEEQNIPLEPSEKVRTYAYPLSQASQYPDMVAYLLEKGMDPNYGAGADPAFTPFYFAAEKACVPCIEMMLAAGAKADIKLPNGKTLVKHLKKKLITKNKAEVIKLISEAAAR